MKNSIDFNTSKKAINDYFDADNFDLKDEYIIEFNCSEFKTLLSALKKYYTQQLYGRKLCNKGYLIEHIKLKIIE